MKPNKLTPERPDRPGKPNACDCNGQCGNRCKCLADGRTPCTAKPAEGRGFSSPDAKRHASRSEAPAPDPERLRKARIAQRAGQMPKSCRAGYLKAAEGKASPREAIKAQCLECVAWNRAEVRRCTATACPLWMYRPWTGSEEKERPAAGTTGRENRNPHAIEQGGSDNEQA
jgi:hypothetical protein